VNDINESVLSSKIRVIAASFPDPPINLQIVSQAKSTITFSWEAGATGGSPIRDYLVYGDQGNTSLQPTNFVELTDTTFLTH